VAKRVPEATIVFHTTSFGFRAVEQLGFPAYYIPSATLRPEISDLEWNRFFEHSLIDTLRVHSIDFAVFDGAGVYKGLQAALHRTGTPALWVTRGGWREPSRHLGVIRGSFDYFRGIMVPGEITAEGDPDLKSVPRELEKNMSAVPPIVFQGPEQLVSREEAIEHLRLDPARGRILLQLGAGNINDTRSAVRTVIAELRRRFPRAMICLALNPIASSRPTVDADIHLVREYPLSRYFRGFDLVVTAAGYNSVHECLLYGIPTILLPNEHTASDDQVKRAERAAVAPLVETVHPFSASAFRLKLGLLFPDRNLATHRNAWQPGLKTHGADKGAHVILRFATKHANSRSGARIRPGPRLPSR
jgi:hypothetical protein